MEQIPKQTSHVERVKNYEILTTAEVVPEGFVTILSRESTEYFLDKGGAGTVYELPSDYCLKLMPDRHTSAHPEKYDLANTALEEARLQARASVLQHDGQTRSPHVYGVITKGITPDEYGTDRHGVIMEQLPAVNLAHICEAKTHPMPEQFAYEAFVADLEEYIEELHETAHVVHGDLFLRNIMIDTVTAQPYVIDYGRSVDLREVKDEQTRHELIDADWALFYKEMDKLKAFTN